MSSTNVLTTLDLSQYGLEKLSSGKVREILTLPKEDAKDGQESLLFVATDRISAYDVILSNGVPQKGALLTQLSAFWFDLIRAAPNLEIADHMISTQLPASVATRLPAEVKQRLEKRSMVVRKLEVIPLESIVRGYITGSAWSEYRKHGTVHGMKVAERLRESEKFPEPLWTPSTKAEQGEHDENISPSRAAEVVGQDLADRIREASIGIYKLVSPFRPASGTKGYMLISEPK
jgi:phosphoribosylaminoimidazole-succinocarboxamide synthase